MGVSTIGASPPLSEVSYVITQWGMAEGLPQSSVNDILQTRDGYIWLATFGGLVRFDGVSFITYDQFNTDCMRSDRVLRLFEDAEARLWVSTEDGLLEFRNNTCKLHSFGTGAKSASALVVRQSGDGILWATAYDTPYRFDGERFLRATIRNDASAVKRALEDADGVWIAYSSQLLRTTGNDIVLVKQMSALTTDNIIDAVEYPKGSGVVYIGTSGNGISRYKNGVIQPVAITRRIHSQFIWKLHVDQEDRLWALNYYGLSLFDGNEFRDYNPLNNVFAINIDIVSMINDDEGNLWLGTTNQGLFQLRESVFSMIDKSHGLLSEQMLSLTLTSDGQFLFATNCGGIYEWKDGRTVPSAINRHLPNQCVWSIFKDSKGRYWIGSRTLYMTEFLDRPGKELDVKSGFPFTDVNAITEDRSGNIWFGSLYGTVIYDGVGYEIINTQKGLSHNDSRVFYEDRSGRMWIGTAQGVNFVDKGRVTQIYLSSGSLKSVEPYVRAIHEDADGVMWFGTYGNGIYRWENGHITNIRREHGLFDNIVSHLMEDENGEFWSGSNRGVFRTSRSLLNDFAAGRVMRVKSEFYTVRDGMNSAETNGGFQPNVIRDDAGNLYFPTVMGVAVASTRAAATIDRVPPVFITAMRSDQNEVPLASAIEFPHNTAYLEIDYTALYYRDSQKIRFRYRLQGLEESWIEVGSRRSALFTKLPPGEYTFMVTASVDGTVWNENPASVSFIVTPPFWGTTWFRGMVAILFIVSGPSVYAYRVKILKKENEKQKRFSERLIESQENERRRIAAELHDGLGQQILVIKNRAELAQQHTADPKVMEDQLREITKSALSSIQDVRTITHDLRPIHIERFGLTEAINGLCGELQQTSPLEWSYHIDNIDEVIPSAQHIHFYRVIQEATNNIHKHANAENATIFIRNASDRLIATIEDDGDGFDAKLHNNDGLGLSGMRERVLTLGGNLSIESSLSEGTVIRITIPKNTQADD